MQDFPLHRLFHIDIHLLRTKYAAGNEYDQSVLHLTHLPDAVTHLL